MARKYVSSEVKAKIYMQGRRSGMKRMKALVKLELKKLIKAISCL